MAPEAPVVLRRGGGEEWGEVTPVFIKMKIYNITDQICKDLDSSQAKTKSPGRCLIAIGPCMCPLLDLPMCLMTSQPAVTKHLVSANSKERYNRTQTRDL